MVPIADFDAFEPRMKIAFPVPGDGAVLDLGRPIRDHHHVPEPLRTWSLGQLLASREPPGPRRGADLQAQGSAALDVESLLDRLA